MVVDPLVSLRHPVVSVSLMLLVNTPQRESQKNQMPPSSRSEIGSGQTPLFAVEKRNLGISLGVGQEIAA